MKKYEYMKIRVKELLSAIEVHISKHLKPNNIKNNNMLGKKFHTCIKKHGGVGSAVSSRPSRHIKGRWEKGMQ